MGVGKATAVDTEEGIMILAGAQLGEAPPIVVKPLTSVPFELARNTFNSISFPVPY